MGLKEGISAFARANAICCQITSGVCFILALSLIIGGSVLINRNSENLRGWMEYCDGISTTTGYSEPLHLWSDFCGEYEVSVKNFAIGVALVFFGCVCLIAASIMVCCACGFAAFSSTSKTTTVVTQNTQPVNQMPMGSYSNQPAPPPILPTSYPPPQPPPAAGYPVQSAPYPTEVLAPVPTGVLPPYDQVVSAPAAQAVPPQKY